MNGSATAAVAEEVPSYLLTGKVAIVTGSGKKSNTPPPACCWLPGARECSHADTH